MDNIICTCNSCSIAGKLAPPCSLSRIHCCPACPPACACQRLGPGAIGASAVPWQSGQKGCWMAVCLPGSLERWVQHVSEVLHGRLDAFIRHP